MNKYLLLSLMGFALMVASPAYAEEAFGETPAEELVDSTEDMSEESLEEFNQDVDCVEAANAGQELPEDCVSTESQGLSDDDMSHDHIDLDITE